MNDRVNIRIFANDDQSNPRFMNIKNNYHSINEIYFVSFEHK